MVINNVIYIGHVELLRAWQSHEEDTRKEVINSIRTSILPYIRLENKQGH